MTPNTPMTELPVDLEPCPFCGADAAELCENPHANMAWVSCIVCGLEAPSETGVTAEQAIDYWNSRPISQSLRAPAGEAEWTRHRDNTFDLDKSFDHPGESHSRAGRNLYNIIDWTGQHRGQIALTHDEYQAVSPIRPLASPPSEGVKK